MVDNSNENPFSFDVQSLPSERSEDDVLLSDSNENNSEIPATWVFEADGETWKSNSRVPEIEMAFSSEEAAYEFYKSYTNEIGFNGICKWRIYPSSMQFNLTLMVAQQVFFWRDGRSKVDYDYFGDVLILGTESSSSASINRKQFSTDENELMIDAVKAVLPGAEHRIGIWYIRRNALNHLSALYIQPGFESFFNKCVPDCQTEEGFDSRWESLLEQFDLPENSWLSSLYKSEMDRENSLRLVCSHRHIKWIRMMAVGALETRKSTLQKQVIMKRTS
ncbi:hypothetical protein OIU78_019819 [Salix suchowensis]|nr:hypothetical protein OIU78_019819 [Salix suchowensis]